MKITRSQLIRLIKEVVEELPTLIYDDIHPVPNDLGELSPYEAYGLSHEAGKEHAEDCEDLGPKYSLEEFNDGSYGKWASTRALGAIINEDDLEEVAPPGMEKRVRALKGKVDNPYAVAWSEYNKENK